MRDHKQGATVLAGLPDQEVDHVLLVGGIEVAGRFVRQQQLRTVEDGATDRHALTFPVGKPRGAGPRPVGEAHRFEQPQRALPGVGIDGGVYVPRKQDVFEHGQVFEQFERLEHLPDLVNTV